MTFSFSENASQFFQWLWRVESALFSVVKADYHPENVVTVNKRDDYENERKDSGKPWVVSFVKSKNLNALNAFTIGQVTKIHPIWYVARYVPLNTNDAPIYVILQKSIKCADVRMSKNVWKCQRSMPEEALHVRGPRSSVQLWRRLKEMNLHFRQFHGELSTSPICHISFNRFVKSL